MAQSHDGAVHYVTIEADRDGQRLDNFLMAHLGRVPRGLVYRLVRTGQVRVNGGRARPMRKLRAGDCVRIPPTSRESDGDAAVPAALVERIRRRIVYSDEHLLVVDKPSGLAMHGGSGLRYGLVDVLARIEDGLHPVHRLDRSTSGLVLIARGRQAAVELQEAFRNRRVEKRYLALLTGHLNSPAMEIDRPLRKIRDGSGQHRVIVDRDGQPARTRLKLLEFAGEFSFVEATIETGRTHQIRAHAAAIGHAVAGDDRYNRQPPPPGLDRLFLHAHYLGLPAPEERSFHAPLPGDLRAVLDHLGHRAGQGD